MRDFQKIPFELNFSHFVTGLAWVERHLSCYLCSDLFCFFDHCNGVPMLTVSERPHNLKRLGHFLDKWIKDNANLEGNIMVDNGISSLLESISLMKKKIEYLGWQLLET
jgi:hypothetical protein